MRIDMDNNSKQKRMRPKLIWFHLSIFGQTSFRVEGIEGEFDLICWYLGLNGIDNFACDAPHHPAL